MTNQRMQLESVLDKLRQIATVNPAQLAIYISETHALLQISPIKFSDEDLRWFDEQVEQIIEIYLGGRLFRDDEYASYRAALN